jgi:hypothetical protein
VTSRAALVFDLAPVAPPCFPARDIWVSYLQSAAEEAREEHRPGPLVFKAGEAVRFNYAFDICEDCCTAHSYEMARQGLCQPHYLRSLGALVAHAKAVSTAAQRETA